MNRFARLDPAPPLPPMEAKSVAALPDGFRVRGTRNLFTSDEAIQ